MNIDLTTKQVEIILRALNHKVQVAKGLGLAEFLDEEEGVIESIKGQI
jgi:hypothetical protein